MSQFANPPFSLDKWGKETAKNDQYGRFFRGIPPANKGDYAFITHMIEITYTDPSENGRVGVILPHGVLFRGGAEGRIRRKLIKENLLDAVIGLPPNLFFGTLIRAVILIFKRSRFDDKVLFIDASEEFEQDNPQNRLRSQDIDRIFTTYQQRKSVDQYAYLASFKEIEESDFNLNISRYVDTFEPEPDIDIVAVQKEISNLEQELADTRKQMLRYLSELGYDA